MDKSIRGNEFSILRLLLLVSTILLLCFGQIDTYICAGLIVVICLWDFKYYLGFKNIFLTYTFLIFDFAGCGYFYKNSNELFMDMLIYLLAFGVGSTAYNLSFQKPKNNTSKTIHENSPTNTEQGSSRLKKLESFLFVLTIFRIILLIYNISKIGLVNFFIGQGLSDKIESYNQEDFQQGLDTIISSFVGSLIIATIVLYICTCLNLKIKVNYRFPIILMIIIPFLSLQRSSVIFGIMFLLMTLYFENKKGLIIKIAVGFAAVIFVGTSIGGLRENNLTGDKASSSTSLEFVYGELSPIVGYQEIKDSVKNGYQYGYTIIAPLLTKPLPRNWFLDKPLNSSAYYMKTYRQSEFDAGFMLAPSIFGDIYFNFGYIGCIVLCFLLGILFNFFDVTLFGHSLMFDSSRSLSYLMIFYNSSYSFLRNNLADSTFAILITILMYEFSKAYLLRHEKN